MQMKKMTKAPLKHFKPSTCRFSFITNNTSSMTFFFLKKKCFINCLFEFKDHSSPLSKDLLHLKNASHLKPCYFEKSSDSRRLSQSTMNPIHTSSHSFSNHFLERSNSLYAPNEVGGSYQKGTKF
jgi:hypothetical protein